MRILKCNKLKWDKRCLIAYGIVIIASIICGIVLFKLNNISNYLYNYADSYIFFVFNFDNGKLIFTHILSELLYLYVVFLLCYFTKLKFLVFPIVFLRTLFAALYTIILTSLFGAEGIMVALIVFLPCYVCSTLFFIFLCEQCRELCTPFAYFCPAVIAAINTLILFLLVNLVFRVIVVIV